MDHRLGHGVFELRNVSMWNCSTIRSSWALSCYKPTSSHCFSRIFPIPCGTQVSMINGSDTSRLCPGLRADACFTIQWGSWSPHSAVILPWAHGSSLLSFLVASCRNQGREETACVYLPYSAGTDWLGCPEPGDRKCFWIHQFRQASGWFCDDCLVWQWESPLCRFKTRATPHPCLHLTSKLFSASIGYFLTFQQKWPSSTSLSLSPQLVPVIRGRLGTVDG